MRTDVWDLQARELVGIDAGNKPFDVDAAHERIESALGGRLPDGGK